MERLRYGRSCSPDGALGDIRESREWQRLRISRFALNPDACRLAHGTPAESTWSQIGTTVTLLDAGHCAQHFEDICQSGPELRGRARSADGVVQTGKNRQLDNADGRQTGLASASILKDGRVVFNI